MSILYGLITAGTNIFSNGEMFGYPGRLLESQRVSGGVSWGRVEFGSQRERVVTSRSGCGLYQKVDIENNCDYYWSVFVFYTPVSYCYCCQVPV